MNEYEARLAIVKRITEVLLDFSEDDPTPEDYESMEVVSEAICESLDLDVMGVVGNVVSVHLDLTDEVDHEADAESL